MKKILATDARQELLETFNIKRGEKKKARTEILDLMVQISPRLVVEERQ